MVLCSEFKVGFLVFPTSCSIAWHQLFISYFDGFNDSHSMYCFTVIRLVHFFKSSACVCIHMDLMLSNGMKIDLSDYSLLVMNGHGETIAYI